MRSVYMHQSVCLRLYVCVFTVEQEGIRLGPCETALVTKYTKNWENNNKKTCSTGVADWRDVHSSLWWHILNDQQCCAKHQQPLLTAVFIFVFASFSHVWYPWRATWSNWCSSQISFYHSYCTLFVYNIYKYLCIHVQYVCTAHETGADISGRRCGKILEMHSKKFFGLGKITPWLL